MLLIVESRLLSDMVMADKPWRGRRQWLVYVGARTLKDCCGGNSTRHPETQGLKKEPILAQSSFVNQKDLARSGQFQVLFRAVIGQLQLSQKDH